MGHIALLETCKSINTYEKSYYYIITFTRRKNPIISLLRIEWFLFVKVEYPSLKDVLCQVWLKLALWFWRRRFLKFVNFLLYFVIISPWNRTWPLIWINLNPLHPRMFYAKFGWNWPSGSREEVENVKFTDWKTPENRCSDKRPMGHIAHLRISLNQ